MIVTTIIEQAKVHYSPTLPVAMNDAWHHSELYTVANYSGMAMRIQVFTVCACDNY